MAVGILIILGIILLVIIWKCIKPYTIKYDSTLFFTGGLGSGKSLTSVKIAVNLLKRARFAWWKENVLRLNIINFFRKRHNIKAEKYNKKHENKQKTIKPLLEKAPKPQIYSNIPINVKLHWWSKKREFSVKLTIKHVELYKELAQHSIVLIDELPQFVNQFNWDIPEVQKNINEMITYFRHYVGGYFIANAQSIDDIVCQIRRKGNMAIMCYDFHTHLFGLFYTIRMCDMVLSDQITSTSSTFLEENTRKYYGLFPPKETYDTRCYSERYKNIYEKIKKNVKQERWTSLKTNEILRIEDYESPLDDNANKEQIKIKVNKLTEREKRQK